MKVINYQLDSEEKEILKALEGGKLKPIKNEKREVERYRKIAKYTLFKLKKDKNINIRMSIDVLSDLKQKALEEGLPYQTLIGSILHKYVTGRLKPV